MMAAIDNPTRFEEMRHAMVASQLRTSAVSDARVVDAMANVAREDFVPEALRSLAYRDRPLPLGGGREMNAPLATGRLLTEAVIGPRDAVLLIGAATGYAVAVIARLAARVVAVEEDAALLAMAPPSLAGTAALRMVEGPLTAGAPDQGPYDVIVVDGAVERLPDALVAQVRVGGRIVTGLVDRGVTRLASGERSEHGFGLFDFADMDCVVLPGFETPRGFRF
ncbi:protein-L-isoaspartate O-methyltransferase family protein [Sphingomonas japonica]|uniref:Protein-L-isoaspartate O-methyltransferase n=1 Tax=Sphingomonas japonica TaxID=511662 RepID=A0ABX0U646_9SPHN|nr:protein-L-isoaspartate O-methyltransferase [Sphingomonas japonica]NIJ24717.1 protein-L-isoaspartate(D-aspartate) O-methyltransferase [Sphingomonas japonica]